MEINYGDIVMEEELLLPGAGMTGWKMVRMKRYERNTATITPFCIIISKTYMFSIQKVSK
jgi:hypothetical protein